MTISERMFQLQSIIPFNRLNETELAIIAEAAVERRYEAGKLIASRNKPARALIVTFKGSLTDNEGKKLANILSPEALLTGTPLPYDVFASKSEGAACLLINKGHFFTILYECPALAMGFISMAVPGNGLNNKDNAAS